MPLPAPATPLSPAPTRTVAYISMRYVACGTHNSGLINSPCLLAANISLQFDARPTNLAGFHKVPRLQRPPLAYNCCATTRWGVELLAGQGTVVETFLKGHAKKSYRVFSAPCKQCELPKGCAKHLEDLN